MVFRDLEAGLPIDRTSSVDEEGMRGVDLFEDCKASSLVEVANEAVFVEAYGHHASSCDVKALVDLELREPLVAHVETDDTKSSQDKEELLSGESKLGGDSLEKEAEGHGLRKRRGTKVDVIKPSDGDSGVGRMPEEEKRGATATRSKDVLTDSSQETKQKPVDKKMGKQGKGSGKASAAKKVGDPQPLEELRAKEEAETNRKVHESLDNFIRQTIRCEPYMNFSSRPGDKPLQRLRPDVFENHVAGKFARGFKIDNQSDPRDTATEESPGVDSFSGDLDGSKDSSAKGVGGLGRGSQHSVKVSPGVVAFTQAAAKGSDLQGWLSPSKITLTKCDKCSREFFSSLNHRRHVRVHRRSLNPEKEDLSKERSKVAAFWDKLTPEQTNNIVHYENMEIEDLSGQSALNALTVFIQPPALPLLPQAILKAGTVLLDIAQHNSSVFPLSSERLLNILDDASEKTFLCGGTSGAVQRNVFTGEPGKFGLEEKNLVAAMAFHIELKLVKAWMADKEAEAMRWTQALVKEEEAAQEKKAKIQEKKRMKKIRQKERKGTASQLVLQESENEPVDDEGNIQGTGEEDDSPTATASSSSSQASAQDLPFAESAELDMMEDLAPVDTSDENVLGSGEETTVEETMSRDQDQLIHSQEGLPQYGQEQSQPSSHPGSSESVYREMDLSIDESVMEDREADALLRPPDEVDRDVDVDASLAHPSSQSKSVRAGEVQSSLHFRKGEQEKVGSDFQRREYDRSALERKPLRITRDRSRNDPPESVPKSGRDIRGFDGRYGEGSQTTFKPARKPSTYFVKSDAGTADFSNIPRVQQYRNKPPGTSRAPSTGGSGQVVWTRKISQPAVEATKDTKEDTSQGEAGSSNVTGVDAWEASEVSQEVALNVSGSAGGDVATRDEEGMEIKEETSTPVSVEVSSGNVITSPTSSSTSVSFNVDVNSEDWPRLPDWSGSDCLRKSAGFGSSALIPTEQHVQSVFQLSEGDSGTVVGPCRGCSSGLMKATLSSVRLQDGRSGSGDDVISAEEMPVAYEEGLSGALLVGSLSVPLGNFVTVSISQTRSGSCAVHPHQADDSEVTNLSPVGSQDQSHGIPSLALPNQEVTMSLGLHSASGSTEESDPHGKGLCGSVRVSGAGPQPIATQAAKLKPHVSLSSPERGDSSRYNASLLGHERLAAKQGSWQTPAGRYVSAKVWRAVGMVGERHDTRTPGLHVAGEDSASSFIDGRPLQQDVDVSGGSEREQENSPNADVRQHSPGLEDEVSREDLRVTHDRSGDQPLAVSSDTGKDDDDQSSPSASLNPIRSVGSEQDLPSEGRVDSSNRPLSGSGNEASDFMQAARTLLNERWRDAVEHASPDEVLNLHSEGVSEDVSENVSEDVSVEEGTDFWSKLLLQVSNLSTRHHPGAESSSSTIDPEVMSSRAHDVGVSSLSTIFSDSDQTGVQDLRPPSTTDEQGLDGAALQDSGTPQTLSSEDDVGLREACSSPVDSEHYMSGSETSRSYIASSAPFISEEEQPSESRGGGGSVGSSHARRGNNRQERWYRNPRDRFPEQRYIPRRRAPVEKNC